jgi:hypothetical protein
MKSVFKQNSLKLFSGDNIDDILRLMLVEDLVGWKIRDPLKGVYKRKKKEITNGDSE